MTDPTPMRSWLSSILPAFAVAVLTWTGCSVGPDYRRPPTPGQPEFRGDRHGVTNSLGDLAWWELFRDPVLQQLITTALTNNYDIRIAAARVEEAQATLASARAQYFPEINYQGAAAAGRNTLEGQPYPTGGKFGKGYFGDLSASWEIDLWGRLRRMNESARAQLLSTKEARTNVMVTLIAQVASDYFQLLALDREMEIARDSTNSFAESYRIFSDRLRGGVSSKLETSAAEAAEASAAAQVPELERQIAIQENQLRILLGEVPASVPRDRRLIDIELAPDVPPGLPSSLLERRPDIRQAEEIVRSANAQVGVATADFYPQLSLTGVVGQVSPELAGLTSGAANGWSVAANLAGPLFRGGALRAQLNFSRAQWKEDVLHYQAAVLNALQEVANALSSRELLARERVEQARAVRAYESAVQVANQRYKAGQATYYELLQEQQLLYPAENALTQTQLNQLLAVVQLYQALGGGWQTQVK